MSQSLLTIFLSFILLQGCTQLPRTTENNSALPVVELQGYRFHAETFGTPDKPVLIVLHGGPGADYLYLRGLKALADEYYVVFYDQRGTGLSPRVAAESITVASFVHDLNMFAQRFSPDRPVSLIGHSWGAMLATAYTSQHPLRVKSLILAEPQFLDQSTIKSLPSGWPGLRVVWGVTRAWFSKWWVNTDNDPYARDDYFLSRLLLLMQLPEEQCGGKLPALTMHRFGSPAFEATIGRTMKDAKFRESLTFVDGIERFTGKTLFLTGACNKLYGTEFQKLHMHHFKSVRLHEVPNAGHFMFNDQPEHTQRIVRAFLSNTTFHSETARINRQ